MQMHIFQGSSDVHVGSANFNNLQNGDQHITHYGDTTYNTDSFNKYSTRNLDSFNHVYNNVKGKKVDKRKTSNTANIHGSDPTYKADPARSSNPRQNQEYSQQPAANQWGPPPPSVPPPRTKMIMEYPQNETLSADSFLAKGDNGRREFMESPPEEEKEYEYADTLQPRRDAWNQKASDNWQTNTMKYQEQAEMNANPSSPMHVPRPTNASSYHWQPPYSHEYTQPPYHAPPGSGGQPDTTPISHPYQNGYYPPRRSPNRYSPNQQYSQLPQPPNQYSPPSPQSTTSEPGYHPDFQPSPTRSKNPYLNPFSKESRNANNASAPPSSTAATTPPADSMDIDCGP